MRILVAAQQIDPPGGGNAVAAWMLQALAGHHAVTTLTAEPWHPELADKYFGTGLADMAIDRLEIGGLARLARHVPGRFDRGRYALLMREVARMKDAFDLVITPDSYASVDTPALQYLHFPAPVDARPARWPVVTAPYLRCATRLSGLTIERARQHVTLANSRWTADRLSASLDRPVQVLYPPVVDPGPGLPWDARSNTLLAVGRFHGSKRLELAIEIVSRVRARLPDVLLHIVGSSVDGEYARRLRGMAAPHAAWVTIEEDLSRAALNRLMGRCRFGLHAMADEHFGMAPAEMLRAGCLVFAHASGGLVEVVPEPQLQWMTAEEAVSRIVALVQDPARVAPLRARLATHAASFAPERFMHDLRTAVAAFTPTPDSRQAK